MSLSSWTLFFVLTSTSIKYTNHKDRGNEIWPEKWQIVFMVWIREICSMCWKALKTKAHPGDVAKMWSLYNVVNCFYVLVFHCKVDKDDVLWIKTLVSHFCISWL